MIKQGTELPTAVVLKLEYAGLGIVRSLSAHGIRVLGLSTYPRACGMSTRHGRTLLCPDPRDNPEGLVEFLLSLSRRLDCAPVLFPAGDNELVFIDRFREQLKPYYALAIAERSALYACLDKSETYACALEAGVPAPACWTVAGPEDVERILPQVTFPCILKPVAAYDWKKAGAWELVGARKACRISSPAELMREYAAVSRVEKRALVQQLISGGDELLVVAACYLDRDSKFVAGFNTQKLLQFPPALGSGCLLQTVHRPELFEPTVRLLQKMGFTGMAEVEYKWDCVAQQYMLIEVNPRAWDQHRLGNCCGVNMPYLAYCELAGLPLPPVQYRPVAKKWVAEDGFISAMTERLRNREPGIGALLRLLKGKRIYAIWDWADPFPALTYITRRLARDLARSVFRRLWSGVRATFQEKPNRETASLSFGILSDRRKI